MVFVVYEEAGDNEGVPTLATFRNLCKHESSDPKYEFLDQIDAKSAWIMPGCFRSLRFLSIFRCTPTSTTQVHCSEDEQVE